jgi:uncharacterized membrane protein (DUF373 family)
LASPQQEPWGKLNGGVEVLQLAIALALFIIGGVVLVRTMIDFLGHPNAYPGSIVSALDGVLVVIIVVDILHTILTHLRSATVPVRPFLVIGILAGVREILSASARLTLTSHETPTFFTESIVELGVGVAVVLVLIGGLYMLRLAARPGEDDIEA